MNSRYIRIIITCVIVGIVMLVLRKKSETPLPTQRCEMNVTPLHGEPEVLTPEDETAPDWQDQEIEDQDEDETEQEEEIENSAEEQEDEDEETFVAQCPRTSTGPMLSGEVTPGIQTAQRTITLNPDISSKDLSYKHGFFSYSPTSITLTVNGEKLEINNDDPITVNIDSSNTVTTHCKYKFIAGHSGEKVSKQRIKPGETYTVTFDWKAPEKIQLEGAEVIFAKNASELAQEENEKDTAASAD